MVKSMSPIPDYLQNIVDHICQQGCDSVNAEIDAMEKGNPVEATRGLSHEDQKCILKELKTIMMVYKNKTE